MRFAFVVVDDAWHWLMSPVYDRDISLVPGQLCDWKMSGITLNNIVKCIRIHTRTDNVTARQTGTVKLHAWWWDTQHQETVTTCVFRVVFSIIKIGRSQDLLYLYNGKCHGKETERTLLVIHCIMDNFERQTGIKSKDDMFSQHHLGT